MILRKSKERKMIINSLMATLHHLCAFAVTAKLVYEFVAFRRNLTVEEARRILKVDTAYGISAGLIVVEALLRVFFFENGRAFSLNKDIYWNKMSLFVLVGLFTI